MRSMRRGRPRLLAPARHPAVEVARDPADADRHRELRRRGSRRSSSRPTSTISLLAVGEPCQPRAEARRGSSGLQIAPGMCASSNCWSVRTSTSSAPSTCFCSTWRGGCQRLGRSPARSGPAVDRDDRLEVRRLRAELAIAGARTRPRRRSRAVRLCARSNAIVEEIFMSIPGPPHIEPPRCPGHTSHSPGSVSSFSCSEWKIAARALAPSRSPDRAGRCRRRTACRRSAPPTAPAPRAVSISANAVCSGRWPGVCSARTVSAPSSSSQPSSNGSCS